jgi:hypothetical protein
MITKEDIEQIEESGYIVEVPSDWAAAQLNQYFPGIELKELLNKVDDLFEEHAKKPLYKSLIIDATPKPSLEIVYRSINHTDPKNGLELNRQFYYLDDVLIAKHVYLSIPAHSRKQKIGTRVLGIFFDQYLKMGVQQIHLLTGLKDGGAVWAKMGFNALYKHEMEDIMNVAEQTMPQTPTLQLAKSIFDSYYKKEANGKSFPIRRWADLEEMEQILKEYSWHGWIDLTNNEELRNFKENVGR